MENDSQIKKDLAEICQKYIDKANSPENEHYAVQENATKKLFKQYPENTNLEEVILKATVLNKFYSTSINDTFTVAKTICSIDGFDSRLANKDFTLVNEIADKIKKTKLKMRTYVFAAKYCAMHMPDVFAFYDKYAGISLLALNKQYHFKDFKKSNLIDYPKYIGIYKGFINAFNLKKFSLRQIDLFLWNYGKDIEKNKQIKTSSSKEEKR